MYMATLPTGLISGILLPLLNTQCKLIDINTLIHSVFHLYHPEITEQSNGHQQHLTQTNNSFEANHIDMYKNPKLNITVCNVQPSQNTAPRIIPPFAIL